MFIRAALAASSVVGASAGNDGVGDRTESNGLFRGAGVEERLGGWLPVDSSPSLLASVFAAALLPDRLGKLGKILTGIITTFLNDDDTIPWLEFGIGVVAFVGSLWISQIADGKNDFGGSRSRAACRFVHYMAVVMRDSVESTPGIARMSWTIVLDRLGKSSVSMSRTRS